MKTLILGFVVAAFHGTISFAETVEFEDVNGKVVYIEKQKVLTKYLELVQSAPSQSHKTTVNDDGSATMEWPYFFFNGQKHSYNGNSRHWASKEEEMDHYRGVCKRLGFDTFLFAQSSSGRSVKEFEDYAGGNVILDSEGSFRKLVWHGNGGWAYWLGQITCKGK